MAQNLNYPFIYKTSSEILFVKKYIHCLVFMNKANWSGSEVLFIMSYIMRYLELHIYG